MELDADLARVIDAVPAWAGLGAEVEVLGGGITNRNFRVDIGGESFVVRLAGKDTELLGVDREAERAATEAAAAAGVAPEVYAYLPEHRALITRFVEADPLPPEDLERPEVMGAVIDAVRAIHGMAPIPSSFDVFRVVRAYRRTAGSRGVRIPEVYGEALSIADRAAEAFAASPTPRRPCHDDLLNANFLMREGRVVIVDYEYAGMGDPFFDLGNLSINNQISEAAQEVLLERYFGTPTRVHRARLALMRVLSDFREAMWGVLQQAISSLDFDYVDYADRHFVRCLEGAADARFGTWLEEARGEPW
ncbi:MAG TPA: phosphotransferase [Actinomycetota bacterium]|nr:phosphotransferase [Actinomycetota bacterium]